MRHQVSGKKLNRNRKHREALFSNLMLGLVTHGRIETTLAKAKVIQNQIEKNITRAKNVTISGRRNLAKSFGKRQTANLLVDKIAKSFATRQGGYTRIINIGERRGDNTMMARIELVDYQKPIVAPPQKEASKTAKPAAKVTAPKTTKPAQAKTPAKKGVSKE